MEETKNNYLNNSMWMLIEKASRIVSGLLVGVLVARYLGPAQFGLISYALSTLAIFTIVSTLGMDSIVVRELITRKDEQKTILGTSFWLRFAGSLAVMLLATTYSWIRDSHEKTWMVFIVSGAIVFQSFTVIDFYFQSQVKGRLSAIIQVTTLLISSVVKLSLIFLEASVYWFAAMAVLEAALSAGNQIRYYHREKQVIRLWHFSWAEAKVLVGFSLPVILSSFLLIIIQKSGEILVLRFLHELDMVGQYSAAVRISEASYFIPVALCGAVYPGIVNNRHNPELQKKRYIQLNSLMIWSAIMIVIGGQLLGDWVINLLYKDKYYLSGALFKLHVWGSIPIFFGTSFGMWLLVQNKQRMIIYFQAINLVVYLTSSFYFLPRYQVMGMAYAVLVTYFSGMFVSIVLYNPRESIPVFIKSLNPIQLWGVVQYTLDQRSKSKVK